MHYLLPLEIASEKPYFHTTGRSLTFSDFQKQSGYFISVIHRDSHHIGKKDLRTRDLFSVLYFSFQSDTKEKECLDLKGKRD